MCPSWSRAVDEGEGKSLLGGFRSGSFSVAGSTCASAWSHDRSGDDSVTGRSWFGCGAHLVALDGLVEGYGGKRFFLSLRSFESPWKRSDAMETRANRTAAPSGRTPWALIVFLFACNLLASFMQSIMNIALDQVSTDFHVRLAEANLVIIVFSIVAGTVITTAASVMKRFGLRKVMIFGLVTGLAGSLLGFIAWCFPVLVVARVVQAFTTGLYFPVINEALLMLSPKGRAGVLLSLNSGIIGIGLAFAPPVAGLLITYAGLRVLFLVPAIFAAVLLVAAFFVVHDISPREKRPIDGLSIVLSFLGLGAFMTGLNEMSHYGLAMVGLMVAGLAIIVLFIWRQRRLEHPLLDMRPFKTKAFSMGEGLVVLSYMGSVYLSLLVPLYLEGAAGFSAFLAGCILVVPILCYACACFVSGKILGRRGVWPLVPAGFLVVLVGFVTMLATLSLLNALVVAACTALVYGGIGIFYPAVKSVDLEVLPPALSSNGSAIHSTVVQVAGCISSALYVGMMSGTVDAQLAAGASKAHAYAVGFADTLPLEIGFIVAAIVLSLVYVRLVRAYTRSQAAGADATRAPSAPVEARGFRKA